jgi:LmbE family N-acetylglucosaminyl deacetylase
MLLSDRVLFVGAHCDDIELMAGGLLSRSCRTARRIGVLVFSDHRGVQDAATAQRALAEFRSNLDWLSSEARAELADHTELLLPACRGAFESERSSIYAALERLRDAYDLVVTHAPADTNQDHRQVAREAQRVFKAHATLLGAEFPANDVARFRPHVYVALAPADVDRKVRMVASYASQHTPGRSYLDETVIRALARVRGSQIGEPFAESFQVAGRIVLRE